MRHAAAPDVDLRAVWKVTTPKIEADAAAFWARLGLLPPDVDPAARAKQLAAVAYKDGQLIGVMTAMLQRIEFLRARFAMIRGAVDPDHRRGHVVSALGGLTRSLLEQWSKDHPEEQVAGIGALVESREFDMFAKRPIWPQTRLAIAGYTPDGQQIRVAWFDHHRLG